MADAVATFAAQPVPSFAIADAVVVAIGELLYYDTATSTLKKADASAVSTRAEWIAVEAGTGGQADGTIAVTKALILTDTDAPYTAGGAQYLSATAGAITETRPSTAGELIQRVGRAISASAIEIAINAPFEVLGAISEMELGANAAQLILDSGPASGIVLATVNDYVVYALPIPENAIGIAAGWLTWSANITLDGSDTIKLDVSSALHGEGHDVVTDTITAFSLAVTVDEMARKDISAGLDVAGLVKPGGILILKVNKEAEGTDGDDPVMFTPHIIWTCV